MCCLVTFPFLLNLQLDRFCFVLFFFSAFDSIKSFRDCASCFLVVGERQVMSASSSTKGKWTFLESTCPVLMSILKPGEKAN